MSDTTEHARKGGFRIQPKGHDEYMVYINMMNQIRTLGEVPVDWGDAGCIRNRVADYFRIMSETNCRPTVSGLAMAFGIRKERLYDLRRGLIRKQFKAITPEGLEEIHKAYDMLAMLYESYLMNDDINPMVGVFVGTNMYGYTNASKVEVTPTLEAENNPSAEAIRLKYAGGNNELPSNTQEDGE